MQAKPNRPDRVKVLHILDHSIPLHSGYTFRTAAILREQRARGWETCHLTSEKQLDCNVREENVDGLHFFRTPLQQGILHNLPVLDHVAVMLSLTRRLREVIRIVKPDILHAHSPVLNALPALRVGREFGLPVVYEVRAFWEDAAADHGTTQEGSLRYRVTRAMETFAFRHADAVTTICEGLRKDIVARGIPAEKVTVIPNAVHRRRQLTLPGAQDLVVQVEVAGAAGGGVALHQRGQQFGALHQVVDLAMRRLAAVDRMLDLVLRLAHPQQQAEVEQQHQADHAEEQPRDLLELHGTHFPARRQAWARQRRS